MPAIAQPSGSLLPKWLLGLGWVLVGAQMLFIGCIVFESTLLTCSEGPQAVGFSLFHGAHNFFLLGLPFVPLSLLFFLGALVFGAVTPLSAAVMSGKQKLVQFVLSKGANVNAASKYVGETPLIDAAYTGNLEIVKLLLAHGAEPCVTDREGTNSLRMAQKYRRQMVSEYLSAHYNCPPRPLSPPSTCASESASTCVEVH